MSKGFTKTDGKDAGSSETEREFYDPRFGQRYVILKTAEETGGEMVRVESTVAPGGGVAVKALASSHPYQEESFEVVSGTLGLTVEGEEHLLGPGERFAVPPGARHATRNAGADELRLVGEMRPAGRFEGFLKEITAANVRAEAADMRGLAYLLTAARVLHRYPDVEHPTPLPRPVEHVVFAVLAAVGGLLDR